MMRSLLVAASALSLSACAVGPDVQAPATPLAQAYATPQPVAQPGAASAELRQDFARADTPQRVLASIDIQLACVRLADQRAVRMPPRWRQALQGMRDEPDSAS